MNVYEAEKQINKLISEHGKATDTNTIILKNLLITMICTTTLLEDDAVYCMDCFLKTGCIPFPEAMQNSKRRATR